MSISNPVTVINVITTAKVINLDVLAKQLPSRRLAIFQRVSITKLFNAMTVQNMPPATTKKITFKHLHIKDNVPAYSN